MKIEKTEKIASADNSMTFNVKSVTVEGVEDVKSALTLFYTLWEGKNTEVSFVEKSIKEEKAKCYTGIG